MNATVEPISIEEINRLQPENKNLKELVLSLSKKNEKYEKTFLALHKILNNDNVEKIFSNCSRAQSIVNKVIEKGENNEQR